MKHKYLLVFWKYAFLIRRLVCLDSKAGVYPVKGMFRLWNGLTIRPGPIACKIYSIRNVAVAFGPAFSFKKQVSNICRSAICHIRDLRRIWIQLNKATAISLANAQVSSRLHYCNSLVFGCAKKIKNKSSACTELPCPSSSLWDEWSKIIFRWILLIISFLGTKTKINISAKNLEGDTFIKMIQKW